MPRKERADAGNELRTLLSEELHGKTPEEATLALEAFGRPSEVAARYYPTFVIIDPADTRAFLRAALAGLIVLAFSASPVVARYGKDALNLLILAWLGCLVLWFGVKSWSIRQWPSRGKWQPIDRDHANRFATVALILVILLGIVCYGAPQWLFAYLTHGGTLTPTFDYTEDFSTHRLPWLLAVWAVTAVLYVVLLIEGRWRFLTRVAALGSNVAVLVILTWFRFDGPMFANPQTDANAKPFVAIVIGILLTITATTYYNMRTDRPVREATGHSK
jgi:hypothetical protein